MRKFAEYAVAWFGIGLYFMLNPIFKWRCNHDKHMFKTNPIKEHQEYCMWCWTVKDKE